MALNADHQNAAHFGVRLAKRQISQDSANERTTN